ncbi:MAG: aldo/keto reductase [Spirochaetales bacterium]|nr:aldo/keto reductase [Spirochaetales bacterium]
MKVSVLGLGCMRLPEQDGKVVRELSTPMLQRAVELGINYFDTAIDYCHGDSQAAVGEALEGLRDKVLLSTKNHHHRAEKSEWRRCLEESLKLLRTDYIDIYSHHGISWEIFVKYLDPENDGLTKEMMRAKEEGLVRHIAFSFHDTPENLIKLIDTGHYESVTLQFNLLDQRNKDAILHAREAGMGVVVMGPLGGGRLGLPNEKISHLIGEEVGSTVEAALRFVLGTPGVNVALSGMQDIRMLEENVRTVEANEPFSAKTIAGLNELVAERKKKSGLYCTGCGYCMPECPVGIAIPENLDLLNLSAIYGLHDTAMTRYRTLKGTAAECVSCGKCVVKCPQNIDIPKQLQRAALEFDERAGTVQLNAAIDKIDPEGTFELRLKVFNFSGETKTVCLTVRPRERVVVRPDVITIENVPPFARLTRTVRGTYAPRSEEIILSVEGICNGDRFSIDKNCRFTFLHKGISADWESGEWFEFRPAAGDFSDAKDTIVQHAVRFKLSYDDTTLLLLADVTDDFLSPTVRKTHNGDLGDCLVLFLDGRKPADIGKPTSDEGVYRIFLYPGTPGKAPPFYKAPRTDMRLKVRAEGTDTGYRLKAEIPLKSFCLEQAPPGKIGFDLACETANEKGVRIGRFRWTGMSENNADASHFREIWLV